MDSGINNKHYDVIVVGGGILGCACAASLAQQGLNLCLIEPSTIGGGTTAAGMGHLVVMDDNPAELALSAYSLELWRELISQHKDLAQAHEYRQCGTIWVASDEEEMQAARAKREILQAHGIISDLLDARALHTHEPQLRAGLAGGLLVPHDALVYAPKSAQLLLDIAIAHGAQRVTDSVTELSDDSVRLASGAVLHAQQIVIANGMASLQLVDDLPLRYKKGHLLITDRYPDFIRHQCVELGYIKSAHASDGDSVAFNLQPRPTGQILIGSSRQFDVTNKAVEMEILSKMLARACEYAPALAQIKALRSWTGFRAATPDGLPYVGPHPHRKHVWMATGHEGLGVTTSLASAALLRDQICGLQSAIAIAPYLPARVIN
ncbi:MAG: FAD-binding oxidoreductase [Burkholderiales bacterium]|nr:FAD-binding oxidoreductase [Burkholderiales bacterium]